VEPKFDVCLEHVYSEISLREFNASAQRFQALCEDDRQRKLVKKVTISVVESWLSFEDPGWHDWLGLVETQRTTNTAGMKVLQAWS
jgi:hypothetical protein